MNKDDTIRMAREAGFICLFPDEAVNGIGTIYNYNSGDEEITEMMERFAALVAARERVETERLMAGHALIREIDVRHQARIAEREECARLCELFAKNECNSDFKAIFVECAAAIRSRGDE